MKSGRSNAPDLLRESGAKGALEEPEARLGQNDAYADPNEVTDYRVSEQVENRDSGKDVPEIDGVRPLAKPPHGGAAKQQSNRGAWPLHDTVQHRQRQP